MTSEDLKNILDDLDDEELRTFLWFLQQPNLVQGLPAITKCQLQTSDRCKTVTVMVQTYGFQKAVQMTRVVLQKISRNDLLVKIPASSSGPEVHVSDVGEPSENREPSSSQTQPPLPQTEGAVQRYGSIVDVDTTGASRETAQQDRLDCLGVDASEKMAETDAERMEKYRSIINAVGRKYDIEPALIAAIISRQSRAGNVLNNGWGAYKTWGLMQVDTNPNGGGHKAKGAWDSEEHLCQGTEILIDFLMRIRNEFRSWTREQQLKGGIAAYITGNVKFECYKKVDEGTPGKDFSNDVVARAQWYKNNGF
ncbi:lysozyme g-like isoform X1 [Acanthochromis polyacanthus]|nr:lysozyme g-like isoform X1 [Acanthochromis polyacanthus]XP_051799528.1 lysozyme g-like isoform X1 [Acanthochromis polyacanthus]